MKYDGILFDLDGTLWDSTEAVAASWKIALQGQPDVEAPPTREQLEGVMGMTGEQLMATLYPQLSPQRHQELFDLCCQVENGYLREHGGRLYPAWWRPWTSSLRSCPCSLSATATRTTFPAF